MGTSRSTPTRAITVLIAVATTARSAGFAESRGAWAPWPRVSWSRAGPETQGLDPRFLDGVGDRAAREHPSLRTVVVVRHGYLVWERAFHGGSLDRRAPVGAITSSIVSALVGWTVDHRRLSERTTLGEIFRDDFKSHPDPANAARGRITVRDLLSMTSGLTWDQSLTRRLFAAPTPTPRARGTHGKPTTPPKQTSFQDPGRPGRWAHAILGLDPAASPGERFFFGDAGWPADLLSEAVARRTGRQLEPLARDVLFGPLGIEAGPWDRDPDGFEIVPYGLSLAPRDLARFGYLYLREGVWDSRRIVSQDWIQRSTSGRSGGGPPESAPYGYLWWTTNETRHNAFFAAGFGGQYVYVVPDLALVVVTTGAMRGEAGKPTDVRAIIREIVAAVR